MAAAKSLTPEEIQQMLEYINTRDLKQRNRAMFLLTAMAGLRVSEVAGLTFADVINADGSVRGELYLAANRVKHQHARTIYLNSRLQDEMAAYVATCASTKPEFPLFPTRRGLRCHFTPNTLAQHFYWQYRTAGIKGASSHSGRKTFLTSLASQGVSVFVLAALAGHRNIATTQRYVTVNDEVKRRAVELV